MAQTNHEDFEYIVSSGGIDEYKLKKNGMGVLLMEDTSAPIVMVMVTYMVGSRNEAIGYTGSTHLLEHLMFKGSKEFNSEKGTTIWSVLQNVGAQINATTWNDRTNYFELLPKEHLETALKIESDRMRNAFIKEDDRRPEMTVVRNEFERGENEPRYALDKHIWATAYMAHPYHHSTIGWRSDIENVPIERLREFYNTFYHPSNAYLTVVGDFERVSTLSLISKLFGVYEASPKELPKMYTEEPAQEGPRRVTVRRAGKVNVLGVAHKSPAGLHPDAFPLKVLQNILTTGQSSRFYKLIVDKGLGTSVSVSNAQFKDPGLFVTYATLTPKTELPVVEKIVLDEYENIKTNGVTEEEVKRSKAQLRTDILFTRDGAFSVASSLNEAIARGDWKSYTTILANIDKVTPEMVRQVARKYFQEDQSTIGYFIPKEDTKKDAEEVSSIQPESTVPGPVKNDNSNAGLLSDRIKEYEPVKGIRLLSLKTSVAEIVAINGSLLGGEQHHENSVIADLTGSMLNQGTKKKTKFEIAEILGSVGASISFSTDNYRIRFTARCLKENVSLILSLIAEQLKEPLFAAEDFETIKKRIIGNLEQAKQSTSTQGTIAFRQCLYPKDHPNCSKDLDEEIALVTATTVDDIRKFHEQAYGVGNMIVVTVGDVDDGVIKASLAENFSSWKVSPLAITPPTKKALPLEVRKRDVILKDKTSADVFLGQSIGIDRMHEDFIPLYVGVYVLGGNFSARLMATVRDKEGLTYGIRSAVEGVENGLDGFWNVSATFAPALIEKGVTSTLAQVEKWLKEGITEDELTNKKSTITGTYKVNLATSRNLASTILTNAERGRQTSYLDEYPKLINALTLDRVNSVIRKYVKFDNLVTVACGTLTEPLAKSNL